MSENSCSAVHHPNTKTIVPSPPHFAAVIPFWSRGASDKNDCPWRPRIKPYWKFGVITKALPRLQASFSCNAVRVVPWACSTPLNYQAPHTLSPALCRETQYRLGTRQKSRLSPALAFSSTYLTLSQWTWVTTRTLKLEMNCEFQ